MNKKIQLSKFIASKGGNTKSNQSLLVTETSPSLPEVDFTLTGILVINNAVSEPLGKPWITTILSQIKSNGDK